MIIIDPTKTDLASADVWPHISGLRQIHKHVHVHTCANMVLACVYRLEYGVCKVEKVLMFLTVCSFEVVDRS